MRPSVRVPCYKRLVADRVRLDDSVVDKLFFAQVREDPVLEIEALEPSPEKTLVVVGSGGCTALSLLGAGGRLPGWGADDGSPRSVPDDRPGAERGGEGVVGRPSEADRAGRARRRR